jgi:hypothetical protein
LYFYEEKVMKTFVKSQLIAGAVCALISSTVLASGSETISAAPSSSAQLYNTGKAVFADKYACSNCPLAGKTLNAELAKEVLKGSPKVTLTNDESEALAAYLKRRFKI